MNYPWWQIYALRKLMQGDRNLPKARMANNYRPTKPINHRTVRTNIDFSNNKKEKGCTMNRNKYYTGEEILNTLPAAYNLPSIISITSWSWRGAFSIENISIKTY